MSGDWNLQTLLERAMQETGLSDFGEPDMAGPLTKLIRSYQEDVDFSEFGYKAYQSRLNMLIENRLRVTEDRKRYPDIAKQKIERPIFITGLPRSGSSFLLDVLAQDPDNRVPRAWEIFLSSPPPEPETYGSDPRIARMTALLEEQGFTDPRILATHPFGAELPEECSFIIEQSFVANNLAGRVPARQYAEWLAAKADHGASYKYHRYLLQNLQYRFRRQRWALKAPSHMFHLQALLDEYPDALILVTHRDLAKVLPSVASMAKALHNIFVEQEAIDSSAIGRNVLTLLSHGIRHTMDVRAKLGRSSQFCDILYTDLRDDPIGVAEEIYARFGIQMASGARAAMSAFVAKGNARHGHGKHHYSLSDYGFDQSELRREFGSYMDAYGVVNED